MKIFLNYGPNKDSPSDDKIERWVEDEFNQNYTVKCYEIDIQHGFLVGVADIPSPP